MVKLQMFIGKKCKDQSLHKDSAVGGKKRNGFPHVILSYKSIS